MHLKWDVSNQEQELQYLITRDITQRKKVANHENLSRQWSSSQDSRQSSSESYERDSPLFQSYKEDAQMLERRLEKAREYECKNNRRVPMSRSHSYDPLDSAFDKLNKDVLNARKNNWQSTDALYNAEEVMNGVETAAEERFQNQRNIIQNLVENLQQKEHQLITANTDIEKLHHDREKLMNEIEDVFKSADFSNKKLIQELEVKEQELSTLNNELSYFKKKTADEIKEKDTKLLEAEKCLKQVEHERKILESERENLMEKVQTDSVLLRKTLEMKENQVRKLNLEMESLKREQEEMLSESVELYNTADKGTSKLKDIIQLRDQQLKEAEQELDRLKQLNDRLVWESRQLTEQADSHSQIMHELLRQREEELSIVQDELKAALQSSDKPQIVSQLQQEIQEKTALLEQKEKELESLKEFLTTTAQKEAVAREKLEKFISDLIDRADKAEKELECLRNYIIQGNSQPCIESSIEDIDSDDEMSEESDQDIQTFSPLRRQAPVKKRKNGCLGNSSHVPSVCDSGYLDSKMASPRSVNLSSSINRPENGSNGKFKQSNQDYQGQGETHELYHSGEYSKGDNYDQTQDQRNLPSHGAPENMAYIPYNNYTGQPVKNQPSYNRPNQSYSNETILSSNYQPHFNQTYSPDINLNSSQENSMSFPSSEYQELRARSLQNPAGRSVSSSDRRTLPQRYNDRSLSSTERQNYDKSLSSTSRQGFSGQGGDNSLSDVVSIADYVPQSENNSFQKIMDENGILWDPEAFNTKHLSPGLQQSFSGNTTHCVRKNNYLSTSGPRIYSEAKLPQRNSGILTNSVLPNGFSSRSEPNIYPAAKVDQMHHFSETAKYSFPQNANLARQVHNNYQDGNQNQINVYQPTLKLKMSDKFIEEKRQFSENIKRILKLPLLREAGNQAELTNDTLRNKLGQYHTTENIDYHNTDTNHQSLGDLRTDVRDNFTQTWIIDKSCMEAYVPNTHTPQNINKTNLLDSQTSNYGSTLLNKHETPRKESPIKKAKTMEENSLTDSETNNSSSYSKLPLKSSAVNKDLYGSQKFIQESGLFKKNIYNEKPRDLFDELKQESLLENNATVNPTEKIPRVDNRQTKNESRNGTYKQCEVNKQGTVQTLLRRSSSRHAKDGISGDNILGNNKPKDNPASDKPLTGTKCTSDTNSDMTSHGNLSDSSRISLPKPNASVTPQQNDTNNSDSITSSISPIKPNVVISTAGPNFSGNTDSSFSASETSRISLPKPNAAVTIATTGNTVEQGNSTMPKPNAAVTVATTGNTVEQGNSTMDHSLFSPQMSEDYEVIETEEEVDSLIYDKSQESNIPDEVVSDTEVEADISHGEDMAITDRRRSLSRQMSMDKGRNSLLDQYGESDLRREPLSLMMEETLTPESVDKIFFAQPELEEDYHHSVSSMDGFTLSRSSSQDSLLSERMTNYSRRELTRRRRQALGHVFSFLDTPSLINVALVCREWKKISRQPSLWKHVYLRNQKCSVQFLLNLAKWCSSMETLHLEDLKVRDKKEFESQEDYTKRVRAILEPGLEKLLQVSESTLKSATIIHCENIITDKGLWLVSCYSRMVRKVTYICNEDLPGADVIWALGAGCRDITHLNITMTDASSAVGVKFNNKCLQVVSQFCQDLQVLCIGGTEIDINGLVLIAKACQRLLTLELHYVSMVTEDTMVAVCRLGFYNLQKISFNFTPVESKAILQLCKSAKHLQKIQVSMDISCFDLKGELKEDEKMKKYSTMVKNLKELEKKPGVGNILKLNCGEVCLNTEKKFFGLF